ncbi:MAG: hypothetical protein WCJ39_09900 [bacterium]
MAKDHGKKTSITDVHLKCAIGKNVRYFVDESGQITKCPHLSDGNCKSEAKIKACFKIKIESPYARCAAISGVHINYKMKEDKFSSCSLEHNGTCLSSCKACVHVSKKVMAYAAH